MLLRRSRLGTTAVLGVAITTFAALAATAHGFPVRHVSLNDGVIWVSNASVGQIGQFAKPIGQLEASLQPTAMSGIVDIWQEGPVAVAYDANGGRLYAVNASVPSFSDGAVAVSPGNGQIALGDTTLAVISGYALRTATLSATGGGGSLSALSATARPLAAHLRPNAAVAVGADDTAWVADGRELHGYPEGGGQPRVFTLPPQLSTDSMQIATVGDVPVVADLTAEKLYLPESGQSVTLPTGNWDGFRLQQSSDASDVVVAATDQALYSVNLSTGWPTTLSVGHLGTAAAPVQVAGCVHGAWADGTNGSYFRTCGGVPPATSDQAFAIDDTQGAASLIFRVNNGSVVLNNTTDGVVYLIDTAVTNVRVQWTKTITAGQSTTRGQANPLNEKTPLTAKPYTQGVRPETTTVVHVLDAAKGAAGTTYVVAAVGTPDQSGVTVSVAPDAQTVLATVTTLSGNAHFQYTIEDGRGHTASAEVTLEPRSPDQNSPPALMPGYQQPALRVASGGTLTVPVVGYWRDFDGDPLYIDSDPRYAGASAGSATVTSGGALSFTAPQATVGQTVSLRYGVSDGRVAKPTMATLRISVLGSSSTTFFAPVAEPDAAQALAGAPTTLQPLANDLPGVDPTNPGATLALAAPLPAVAGATVSTDLANGTVTFTAQHPGDFFLSYTDSFGAAPTAAGTIRVHVIPATGVPKPPVTTPAVAVLHGQQPAVVDVLAGDFDPQGAILGVTSATSAAPGVRVTVVDQRWLRISAGNPQPGMAATVDYTVSDGRASAEGTVAVSAVPADANGDQIATTDAAITVRSGDSAAVAVLAGDTSSTGLPLSLAGNPPTATPPVAGLLASVQGGDIRVTAPAGLKAEEETAVSYVATDASGTTATGSINVTIMPPPSRSNPDQAPVPEEVDVRETAGDVAVITIPVSGIDPDGDSVTVTGVTVPPALGRIVAVGPDSISYQSYPDSAGTDTFSYQVSDPYGLTGAAQVRIAVLPPGPPQPPVAVDDVINAPPGVSLHWNVLGNDFVAPGDTATIEPLGKTNKAVPAGVRLEGTYAYLTVPASPSDQPVQFSYGLTDGSAPSLAQVIVHAVTGAQLPPIASDDVAPPPPAGAATVTVNVLKNDDDPVGSPSDLKISWAPHGVTVHGAELTIKLAAQPREVPYQVTAPDGLSATAVVYVPGTAASAIRLRPGARLTLKRNGSITVPLSSVLIDTSGRRLRITTLNELTASPGGELAVNASQATAFGIHALGGYTGPGAVTVQVYDGATLQDAHGNTTTVTIPVQVGPDVPVLRCPAAPLLVVEGGAAQGYDIGQLCHVWVDTTVAISPPRYTVAWGEQPGGVSASVPGGTGLQLNAASGAAPGSTGTLRIIPAGAATGGTLNIAVIRAPLPAGRPVSVSVNASQAVTVDLSQYVTSPLAQPDIQVLSVTRQPGATVANSGSTVTITPAHATTGTLSLVATVTDVAGRADREIRVAVTVTVVGFPGMPSGLTAAVSSHTIEVSFGGATPNGAPTILYYTVYVDGAGHQCYGTRCIITGLTNGTPYTVYVKATNIVGPGRASLPIKAEPNALPNQVTGVSLAAADGKIAMTWQAAGDPGSRLTGYQVEITTGLSAGQPQPPLVGGTSDTFRGLTNGTMYTFTVRAVNQLGSGAPSGPASAIPFGKPLWTSLSEPAAAGASLPTAADQRAITVTWSAPDDNGRPITDYSVQVYTSSLAAGPFTPDTADGVAPSPPGDLAASAGTYSKSFNAANNSLWYEYAITAYNIAPAASVPGSDTVSSLTGPIQAALNPGAPGNAGVSNAPAATGPSYGSGTIRVNFTVPRPHSANLSYVAWALNGGGFTSGDRWSGLTPGANVSEPITGLNNLTTYAVSIEACNDAGFCSQPVDAGSVEPYGQPDAPAGAPPVPSGTGVTWNWSGGGQEGQPIGYYCVSFDGGVPCQNVGTANNLYRDYGAYNQSHTFSVAFVDAKGWSSAATTMTATTGPPPPPPPPAPPPSVSVTPGTQESVAGCTTSNCYAVHVTVANFPAGADLQYECSDASGQYWPTPSGTTIDANFNGVPQHADGTGAASFDTECVWGNWTLAQTISVTVNGHTGSHTG